jgi:hypothetical protein
LFISAFKDFVNKVSARSSEVKGLLEKMNHFGMAISVDEVVTGFQKQEVSVSPISL